MNQSLSYKIFPLGDGALVVDFGNIIDESINKQVHALFYRLQKDPIPGMIEAVPAYSSLTLYYDVLFIRNKLSRQTKAFDWIAEKVKKYLSVEQNNIGHEERMVTVPVCYDRVYGPDLDHIASQHNISVDAIIGLHTCAVYSVYMIGFLPGFAYMASVDEKIASPRKLQPVPVEAGSVGIAGRQTGIYPLKSPGGWQIIGRTPLKLFDKGEEEPVLFRPGDKVQFIPISKNEFEDIKSRNT